MNVSVALIGRRSMNYGKGCRFHRKSVMQFLNTWPCQRKEIWKLLVTFWQFASIKNYFKPVFLPFPRLYNVAWIKASKCPIILLNTDDNIFMSSTVSYKLRSNVLRNWNLKIFRMSLRPFGTRLRSSGISAFIALTNGKRLCPIMMVSCHFSELHCWLSFVMK